MASRTAQAVQRAGVLDRVDRSLDEVLNILRNTVLTLRLNGMEVKANILAAVGDEIRREKDSL